MVSCRSIERVVEVIRRELVDAVVIDVRKVGVESVVGIVRDHPGIPVFALSLFGPDDGCLIAECVAGGVRGVLVQGVDDSIVGEVLMSHSASRRRREQLAAAPDLLRLSEPLQRKAWNAVLDEVGHAMTTADIAASLGRTREYVSREFAAGGAPNLKRVIDLVRLAWAADLLKDPGYTVGIVSKILRFSSPSHLAGCAKRVAGVAPAQLANLGPAGVLQRFRRGRTRSRL
jgi:AraC-like DNA-binding protein